MKIEIIQEKLSKALNLVSKVASGSRATLPILNNVLIKVEDKKVSLTATNLDVAIIDYIPTSNSENGSITIPARLLTDFISNLPKGEKIEIESKDNKVKIKSGKYSSIINGTPSDDYPELPDIDEKNAIKFKMNVDDFKEGLSGIVIATSNDLTRPALTGVYFNTNDGNLYLAATDGYRLAEKKFINNVKSEVMAIVPAESLQEVLRSISNEDEIEILFDDSQVRFRFGEIEITSKLIDGSFPDYRQLIPKESEINLKLKKDELSRITKLAALFAREVGGSVICESKESENIFSVSSVANEYGENNSEIETEVEKDGKVMLNSRFLLDALNVLDEDEIIFGFSNKLDPVVLKNSKNNSEYTHIIMPLKI